MKNDPAVGVGATGPPARAVMGSTGTYGRVVPFLLLCLGGAIVGLGALVIVVVALLEKA